MPSVSDIYDYKKPFNHLKMYSLAISFTDVRVHEVVFGLAYVYRNSGRFSEL